MNKKKTMIVSLMAIMLLMSVPVQVMALTIEATGSGLYIQETNLVDGSTTLHDELTINAGLWNLDMDIGTGSFSLDRRVSFTDPMHSSTVNQGYFAGVTFDTTYNDGNTEDVNVFGQLELFKTFKNMHGPGYMEQAYVADNSIDSSIWTQTGTADSYFLVGLSGTVADGDFAFSYDHRSSNGLMDKSEFSASNPILAFGIYGGSGSSTVDVYAGADFALNVDGTIGYNKPWSSNGVVGYMSPSSTFTGTEINFSGTLLDITISGFSTGGNWNHVYPSFGFTTQLSTP